MDELEKGYKFELEIQGDETIAKSISEKNVGKDPNYYTKLEKSEKTMDFLVEKYNEGQVELMPILEKMVNDFNKMSR